MRVTFGGSMGFTVQPKQYESINASATFSVEKEFEDGVKIDAEELKEISNKVNETLAREATKHLKTAVSEYWGSLKNIAKKR